MKQDDRINYVSDPEWRFHPRLLELLRLRRETQWRSELIFTADNMCLDRNQFVERGIRDAAVVIVIVGKRGMPEWLGPGGVADPAEQARQAHEWLTALNKPCWILRLSDHYLQQCGLPDAGTDVYAEFWAHFIKLCPVVCDIRDPDHLGQVICDICDGRQPGSPGSAPPKVITGAVALPPPPPEVVIFMDPTGGGLQPPSHVLEQPADPITLSAERENRALDDNVQFTVFQPEVITPDQWCDFLAYAHLSTKRPDAPEHEPDPKKEIERRARAALGAAYDEYDRLRQNSSVAFPKDGEVTFAPEMEGAEFNPRSVTFLWAESVHEARFRVRAKAGAPKGPHLRGRMNVYLGPLLVASVELAMDVDPIGLGVGMRPTVPATAETYRTIFASYSHHDTEIVRACQAYASSLGDRLIRDQDFLRGGQDWRAEISRAIERADVFQLFWSPNSAASREVRWEVECALAMPKQNFVRPTYWQTPMPSPWSDQPDISSLHFERMPFGQAQPAYSDESPSARFDNLGFDDYSDEDDDNDPSPPLRAPSVPIDPYPTPRGGSTVDTASPAHYPAPARSSSSPFPPVSGRSSSRWIGMVAAVALIGGVSLFMMNNMTGKLDRPPPLPTNSEIVMEIYRQEAEAKTAGGKHAEAEKLWRLLLAMQERHLEPNHPKTLTTCLDLALCLEALARRADALPFAVRAREGFRKLYGEDHPDTRRAKDAAERAGAR